MEKQNFLRTYRIECISFMKAPFSKRVNIVYVAINQWTISLLLFQVYEVLKLTDIEETHPFPLHKILVLKHQVTGEQKLPLCFWQDFESTGLVVRFPNCKFSLKNLSETLLNWKVLPQFTGLQFWCLFHLGFIFWFCFGKRSANCVNLDLQQQNSARKYEQQHFKV